MCVNRRPSGTVGGGAERRLPAASPEGSCDESILWKLQQRLSDALAHELDEADLAYISFAHKRRISPYK